MWILNNHTPISKWKKISIFFEWYVKCLQTGQYDVLQAGHQAFKCLNDPKEITDDESKIMHHSGSEEKIAKEVFQFNCHTRHFVDLFYKLFIEMEQPPPPPNLPCYHSYIYKKTMTQFVIKLVIATFRWNWDSKSIIDRP